MTRADVLAGLQAEGAQLAAVLLDLGEEDFRRPTPCAPWTVAELLAHVLVATNRLPAMLAEPEPALAEIGAAEYYRPDERFGPDATRARVDTAQVDAAAAGTGHALAERFDAAWREMAALAAAELPARVVRTRWGDAMLLIDFLVTRVVELAVHGLDLAAGLDREPWITTEAAVVTERLLLGPDGTATLGTMGWDRVGFIRKATGRAPLTADEARLMTEHRVRWLTLG